MKLGIISDCTHYKTKDGKVATENHILLRQLQALCSYFDETLICCPFAELDEKKVVTDYDAKDIKFLPLPVVGGDKLIDKVRLFTTLPLWFKNFKKVRSFSDVVYQRFPNNLNIPGFFYFYFNRKKVFATYTGTWQNYPGEPATFRFQKWFLKKYFRGPVWVYTDKLQPGEKILGGFSPSYSKSEWDEETSQVAARIESIQREGIKLFRLITVGTLIDYKNQLTILKACSILKGRGFPFYLKVVGDGPMYEELNSFIKANDLQQTVELSGKKNQVELRELYRQSDFVVQAPLSEGFGKVPVEGFFHGVIPIINDLTMARHITDNGTRGFLFDASSPESLADAIEGLQYKMDELPGFIARGREFAKSQTLEAWAEDYYQTVTNYFG